MKAYISTFLCFYMFRYMMLNFLTRCDTCYKLQIFLLLKDFLFVFVFVCKFVEFNNLVCISYKSSRLLGTQHARCFVPVMSHIKYVRAKTTLRRFNKCHNAFKRFYTLFYIFSYISRYNRLKIAYRRYFYMFSYLLTALKR